MDDYERRTHPLLVEFNEEKEVKMLHEDLRREAFEFDSEILTGLLFDLSSSLLEEVTLEVALLLRSRNGLIY